MTTLTNKSGPAGEEPSDRLPLRWVVIVAASVATGCGAGAAAGWPQGVIAGTGLAAALHMLIRS